MGCLARKVSQFTRSSVECGSRVNASLTVKRFFDSLKRKWFHIEPLPLVAYSPTSDMVLLFYTISEVYTIFGMVSIYLNIISKRYYFPCADTGSKCLFSSFPMCATILSSIIVSCDIVSLYRSVTVPFSKVLSSTVIAYGIPMASPLL